MHYHTTVHYYKEKSLQLYLLFCFECHLKVAACYFFFFCGMGLRLSIIVHLIWHFWSRATLVQSLMLDSAPIWSAQSAMALNGNTLTSYPFFLGVRALRCSSYVTPTISNCIFKVHVARQAISLLEVESGLVVQRSIVLTEAHETWEVVICLQVLWKGFVFMYSPWLNNLIWQCYLI